MAKSKAVHHVIHCGVCVHLNQVLFSRQIKGFESLIESPLIFLPLNDLLNDPVIDLLRKGCLSCKDALQKDAYLEKMRSKRVLILKRCAPKGCLS